MPEITAHLLDMGLSGIIIIGLLITVRHLWGEIKCERGRTAEVQTQKDALTQEMIAAMTELTTTVMNLGKVLEGSILRLSEQTELKSDLARLLRAQKQRDDHERQKRNP